MIHNITLIYAYEKLKKPFVIDLFLLVCFFFFLLVITENVKIFQNLKVLFKCRILTKKKKRN